MPSKPKSACPVCRRLRCSDPSHVRKPFANIDAKRRLPRLEYNSAAEIARRKAVVAAFLDQHGFPMPDGRTAARCPDCGKVKVKFDADHITPLAEGGSEDGPLRVHCRSCSGRQGAQLLNKRRRPPTTRTVGGYED